MAGGAQDLQCKFGRPGNSNIIVSRRGFEMLRDGYSGGIVGGTSCGSGALLPASNGNASMPSTARKPRKNVKPPPRKRVKRSSRVSSEEHSEFAASGAEETDDVVEGLDSDHLDDDPPPKKAQKHSPVKKEDTQGGKRSRKRKRDEGAEDDQSGGRDEGKGKVKVVGTIVQAPTIGRGGYI
jgi:hypothetical protein